MLTGLKVDVTVFHISQKLPLVVVSERKVLPIWTYVDASLGFGPTGILYLYGYLISHDPTGLYLHKGVIENVNCSHHYFHI